MEHHETLNAAEEFVYRICRRSFLSLWSYPNPQGKDASKELCDLLIVCEPDIIIFSVKDIKLTDSGDEKTDWERWRKRAIEASCKQVYGAERFIKTASHVIRKDGSPGLQLSEDVTWRIHRVAVALGSQGKAPLQFGDFGKGFVHVVDEESFSIILQELDTIEDFITYLAAKENLYANGVATFFHGAEEDLLALYLHNGRSFPQGPDMYILDAGLWSDLTRKDKYRRKKLADRDSYVWDSLIEALFDSQPASIEPGPSLTEADLALRIMARETRFSRRILGKALREFLIDAQAKRTRARMTKSLADIAYVFVHCEHGEDVKYRQAELCHRCFIARGTMQNCQTVIGISTEEYKKGEGCSSTLMYLQKDTWTDEDEAHMQATRNELGFFKTPLSKSIHEDEYPEADGQIVMRPGHKVGRNELCPCGSGKKYKRCHLFQE